MHAKCLSNANFLLRLLGVEFKVEDRFNVSRQEVQDCGWYVCHYIEEHLRVFAGHAPQSNQWPDGVRLRKLMVYLGKVVDTLETWRVKWVEEAAIARATLAEKRETLREVSEGFLKRKRLLARAVELHAKVGELSLNLGASAEPLALDGYFLLRYEQ